MEKKPSTFRTLLGRSLVVSLLIHLVVVGTNYLPSQSEPPTPTPSPQEAVHKIRLVLKPERAKEGKKRQVVETESSRTVLNVPIETRFLGEKSQAVDRQSVARRTGSFKAAGRGRDDAADAPENRSVHKKRISLSDLSPGSKASYSETTRTQKGRKNGRRDEVGEGRSNDFIDDVPLGDLTKLNTTQFKYYGFYHRIKKQLENYWGREVRKQTEHIIRRGRAPASTASITALAVVLDHKGKIIDITVKSASGIKELDRAAVDSFNKAGPFPNPPEGMLKDGKVKIEWGFVVKS